MQKYVRLFFEAEATRLVHIPQIDPTVERAAREILIQVAIDEWLPPPSSIPASE